MIHCHELSGHSFKFTPKYFQRSPQINDVIFSIYENEGNKRNHLSFQYAQ